MFTLGPPPRFNVKSAPEPPDDAILTGATGYTVYTPGSVTCVATIPPLESTAVTTPLATEVCVPPLIENVSPGVYPVPALAKSNCITDKVVALWHQFSETYSNTNSDDVSVDAIDGSMENADAPPMSVVVVL